MSKEIKILEYETKIKIIPERAVVIEYDLPPYEVKHELFGSKNGETPFQKPKNHKYNSNEEEKKLRLKGEAINQYLDFIKSEKVKNKHKFVCELYKLSQKTSEELLERVIKRALQYRVKSVEILTNIASWMLRVDGNGHFDDFISSEFKDRAAYQDGRFSEESSIANYQQLFLGENL